jgi:transcriptional regulator with XRE-family HTH domain
MAAKGSGDLEIARRVRAARKRCGWTQSQLAEKIGMSRATIANIEICNQNPTIHTLTDIAEALGVAVGALLPLPDNEDREPALRGMSWYDPLSAR